MSRFIAQRLPDLPRWVEVRALLLNDSAEVFGYQKRPELSAVVRAVDSSSIFIVGRPSEAAVRAALEKNHYGGEVIVPHEHAAWLAAQLSHWTRATIIVHHLPAGQRLPEVPPGRVEFLDPGVIPQLSLEEELKQELESGAKQSVIAATFVDRQPVSFCYAGAITESLWDISIDTVPAHQRRGYAAVCVSHLIRHMAAQGKRPVWQALEANLASRRLAQKLGFVPMDDLVMFARP